MTKWRWRRDEDEEIFSQLRLSVFLSATYFRWATTAWHWKTLPLLLTLSVACEWMEGVGRESCDHPALPLSRSLDMIREWLKTHLPRNSLLEDLTPSTWPGKGRQMSVGMPVCHLDTKFPQIWVKVTISRFITKKIVGNFHKSTKSSIAKPGRQMAFFSIDRKAAFVWDKNTH